jgi:hypothetical protein
LLEIAPRNSNRIPGGTEADGVNPLELEGMLRQVAQRLRIPSGQHQAGLTRQF